MSNEDFLWVCGQVRVDKQDDSNVITIVSPWEFVGVFSTEEKAIAACRDWNYFIAPCVLNECFPEETTPWIGGYYPLAEQKPKSKD